MNVLSAILRRDANRAGPRRAGTGRQTTKRHFTLSLNGPRFAVPATTYGAADAQQQQQQQADDPLPIRREDSDADVENAGPAAEGVAPVPISWDDEAMLPADFGAPAPTAAEASTSTAPNRQSMGTSPINFAAPASRPSMGEVPMARREAGAASLVGEVRMA